MLEHYMLACGVECIVFVISSNTGKNDQLQDEYMKVFIMHIAVRVLIQHRHCTSSRGGNESHLQFP